MVPAEKPTLNQGQQAAADAVFQFLLDDRKEMSISGPGGVGKTFMMQYIIDTVVPRFHETCRLLGYESHLQDLAVTATTNQAAEVLSLATGQDASTIHNFLRLKVKNDYKTGKTTLTKRRDYGTIMNTIVFIDEASMIDSQLYYLIHSTLLNCKIIYLGDHCQLAPVLERLSPVYTNNIEMVELTEPMRNAGQPALIALCNQLRETVETQEFKPIQIVPGVIDYATDEEMEQLVNSEFAEQTDDARILAYTNRRVNDYNGHIRWLRQLPEEYVVGERLINNSSITLDRQMIRTDQQVTILWLGSKEIIELEDNGQLEIIHAELALGGLTTARVKLPVDREHFTQLIKHYASKKMWPTHFMLKEGFPDLRPADSSTTHKAQGSSRDTVFIDLSDISTCHNPSTASRMLYVAVSRARKRIIFYGELAQKYGGLVHP